MRRIVTGRSADGGSTFIDDGPVAPLTASLFAGITNYPVWSTDAAAPSSAGAARPDGRFYPGPGGLRFFVFTIAPAHLVQAPNPPQDADVEEAERKFPGLLAAMTEDPDEPGMHATATIDFGVVLAGEVVLELDGGAQRTLRQGDVVVQDGARHRWHNRGDQDVVLAFVIVGTAA